MPNHLPFSLARGNNGSTNINGTNMFNSNQQQAIERSNSHFANLYVAAQEFATCYPVEFQRLARQHFPNVVPQPPSETIANFLQNNFTQLATTPITQWVEDFTTNGFSTIRGNNETIALFAWDTIVERVVNPKNAEVRLEIGAVQSQRFISYFSKDHHDERIVSQMVVSAILFKKELYRQINFRLQATAYWQFQILCRDACTLIPNNLTRPSWLERPPVNWADLLSFLRGSVPKYQLREVKLICWLIVDTAHRCFVEPSALKAVGLSVKEFMLYEDSGTGDRIKRLSAKPFTPKVVNMQAQELKGQLMKELVIGVAAKIQKQDIPKINTGCLTHSEYVSEYIRAVESDNVNNDPPEGVFLGPYDDANNGLPDGGIFLADGGNGNHSLRDDVPDASNLSVRGSVYLPPSLPDDDNSSGVLDSPPLDLDNEYELDGTAASSMSNPVVAGRPGLTLANPPVNQVHFWTTHGSNQTERSDIGVLASDVRLPSNTSPNQVSTERTTAIGGAVTAANPAAASDVRLPSNTSPHQVSTETTTAIGGALATGEGLPAIMPAGQVSTAPTATTANHISILTEDSSSAADTFPPMANPTTTTVIFQSFSLRNVDGKCSSCDAVSCPHHHMNSTKLDHRLCNECYGQRPYECCHTHPDSFTKFQENAIFMKPLEKNEKYATKQCSVCGVFKPLSPQSPFHYCKGCSLHRVCHGCFELGNLVLTTGQEITAFHNEHPHPVSTLCTHDIYDDIASYECIVTWNYTWNQGSIARNCSICNSKKKLTSTNSMHVCRHCCQRESKHCVCQLCWNNLICTQTTGNKQRRKAARDHSLIKPR